MPCIIKFYCLKQYKNIIELKAGVHYHSVLSNLVIASFMVLRMSDNTPVLTPAECFTANDDLMKEI